MMKNKILKFALSTMLAVLLATMTAMAEDVTYKYIDANGVEQEHTATVLTSAEDFGESPTLGVSGQETWYIVTGTINLSKTLNINGAVHLILADGSVLSVTDGYIYIASNSSLTVYSQSYGEDMGKLTIEGGSTSILTRDALTINGGFVTAEGNIGGAFTFNGGKLVATSFINGGIATIGYNSPSDYVQLNKSLNYPIQIKTGKHFVTEDGKVAEGEISVSDFNSTFGGQKLVPRCKVTVNGDHIVYVRPGETINASTVGYAISNIQYANGDAFNIETPVTTDLDLRAVLGDPTEYTITYNLAAEDATNNVDNPYTYTVETPTFSLKAPRREGYVFVGWTYDGLIEPTKNVTIEKGSIGNKTFTAVWKEGGFLYLDADGNRQWTDATELKLADDFGESPKLGVSGQETWYIVTGTINLSKTLYINGDVHLILADNAELSVNGGNYYGCCIYGSLTLYSQSYGDDMGKLTVEGSTGIYTNNALTINGGFVTAQGANDVSIDIDGSFTFNGGKLVANTGKVWGNATLGYNSPNDYVQIKQVAGSNSKVTIKSGQHFVTSGGDVAGGTIEADAFNATFGGKTLMPRCKVTVNGDHIVYVRPGETINASTVGYAISNIQYANGDAFNIETPVTTDLDLTADLGDPTEYTITYNLAAEDATNNVDNPDTYTVETPTFSLKAPRREGYAFVGWTYDGLIEPTKNVTIEKGSIGNKTFTAVWKEGGVLYLDENGDEQWADATELKSADDFGESPKLGVSGQETWYIVTGTINLSKTLYINNGAVHLILADGAALNVKLESQTAICIYSSLTVYSQSYGDNMGTLTTEGFRGIYSLDASLIINGGFVSATGNIHNYDVLGDFTFNGGRLVANTGLIEGNATIGFNSPDDYVQIGQVVNGSVTIKDGKHFISANGDVADGTIEAAAFNETFGGETLMPRCKVTLTIGDETKTMYVIPGKTVTLPTKDGYTLSDIKDENNVDYDITEAVTKDLALTAEWEALPATAPTINTNPDNLELAYGYTEGNTLLVAAEAASDHTISYQWYIADDIEEDGAAIDGATSDSYEIPTGKYAGVMEYYYCVVTAKRDDNGKTATATSARARVAIKDKVEEHGALTIRENQDGKVAIFNGNYRGSGTLDITSDIEGLSSVTFEREFSAVDEYSTIMLPLDIANPEQYGTFGRFEGVTKVGDEWIADISTVSSVEAYTPYIFRPNSTTPNFTWNVITLKKPKDGPYTDKVGKWTLTGVTEVKKWDTDDNNDYGFAGQTSTSTGDYKIGEFIKVAAGAKLSPFRCYLTYDDNSLGKAAEELPTTIRVRIINAVVEPDVEPIDPEEGGDIETPVSEIKPVKSDIRVWAYDKTIYIEAQADMAYRIIDLSGKTLQNGVTTSTRQEIQLGSRVNGIVIVWIGGKSFKIKY